MAEHKRTRNLNEHSGNSSPKQRHMFIDSEDEASSSEHLEILNPTSPTPSNQLSASLLTLSPSIAVEDYLQDSGTAVYIHYRIDGKTNEEGATLFNLSLVALLPHNPIFSESMYNPVTKQINFAFSNTIDADKGARVIEGSHHLSSLIVDNKNLGFSISEDLIDAMNRDPLEERRKTLYISPVNKTLKDTEMIFTAEEIIVGIHQVIIDQEPLLLARKETIRVRNNKGFASVVFPDMEFLIITKDFFLSDRRVFAIRNNAYQFVVPKEKIDMSEIFIGGWNQVKLSPRIVMGFLSRINGFPKIWSVSVPIDKRSGTYNPFFCFITVSEKDVNKVLAMKPTSNGKPLKIAVAYKQNK